MVSYEFNNKRCFNLMCFLAPVSIILEEQKAEAALVRNENGEVDGIITDKDLALRGVVNEYDVNTEPVSSLMTRDLVWISSRDPALQVYPCPLFLSNSAFVNPLRPLPPFPFHACRYIRTFTAKQPFNP